ncbi:MAG: putative delta-60 repeat protein, partial [Phenylobacterium sp.]
SDNILIAATNIHNDFNLIKFSADGTTHVDLAVDINASSSDFATGIVLQSDGKALIVGTTFNSPAPSRPAATAAISSSQGDFAIARFDVTSTPMLDTTYNESGIEIFDFGHNLDDTAMDAYINDADEVIIVGGSMHPTGNENDFAALKIDNTGTLQTSFGTNGLLVVDIDGDGDGTTNQSIATQVTSDASGNLHFAIFTGTSNYDTVIYQTDANGNANTAYGTAGTPGQAIFSHSTSDNVGADLLIDSSNRAVLLATTTINIEPDIVVARYTTAGVLDTSFDTDGFNILDPTFSTDSLSEMIELTVAPHTGKFIAVGTSGAGSFQQLIVARFNADGSQDETFGNNGHFVHRGDEATIVGKDIVELSDGKLVAVGAFDLGGLIVMLTNDGILETNFNTVGHMKLTSNEVILNAVAVDSASNIIVAGTDGSSLKDLYMAKMNLSGVMDTSFSGDGIAIISLSASLQIEDMALQSDNTMIVVGQKSIQGFVAKVRTTGTLDTSFAPAGNGYVSLDLDPDNAGNTDILKRVKIKSDGKIVAAGYSVISQATNVILQLNSNGSVDTTFDTDGIASHQYGTGNTKTFGLALDTTEKIVITGYGENGTDQDIFVARVDALGAIDTLFNDATGGILFDYTNNESATAVLVQSDGTIVIGGSGKLNIFPTDFFFIQKLKLVEP